MNVAVVPATVQTDCVVEAKLTARLELAVAASVSGVPTVWAAIVGKLIVCDAALAIFAQEPRTCTGRQWIDEDALASLAGIVDFDHYWCEGAPPPNPIYIDRW